MDTYTVTFTNGNTTTFTVTNGEKGDKGDKGDKGNTGNTGATGNGISTVAKTGTSGLVDTYTITFTNGTTTTFTVTNGADGTVPIVTSWESTLSDSKVASEKLTKNALDGKQATLVSGTNIKTINNESLLGNGNITVAPQIDIQTSWGNPTSDSKVASEKLIKDSLDGKLDNTIGSSAVTIASDDNIVITDTSDSNKVKKVANLLASQVKDSTAHSNIGSSANDTQATINSDIDTALSNKVSKSSTTGLLKNDGSVMASGTGSSNWAVGNHTHSAYVNPTKVTSWSSTPSDDNVASEKLIKNSLDGKLDNSNSSTTVTIASEDKILITDYSDSNKIKRADNILASQVKDGSAYSNIGSSANATQSSINSSIDTALGGKQATLVSGQNIKTINDESLLGNGNLTIQTLDDTKLFKYYYAPNDFMTPNKWYADYDHGYPNLETGNLIFTTDYEYRFVFNEYPQKVRENFSIRFKYKASASNQYNILRINGTTIVQNTTTENDVEITTTSGNAIVTNYTTNQTWDLQGNLVQIDLLVRSGTASIYGYTYSANDSFEKQVPTEKVIQGTALSNIGTSKGATQSEINSAIASAIGSAITYIIGSGS